MPGWLGARSIQRNTPIIMALIARSFQLLGWHQTITKVKMRRRIAHGGFCPEPVNSTDMLHLIRLAWHLACRDPSQRRTTRVQGCGLIVELEPPARSDMWLCNGEESAKRTAQYQKHLFSWACDHFACCNLLLIFSSEAATAAALDRHRSYDRHHPATHPCTGGNAVNRSLLYRAFGGMALPAPEL